MSYLLNLISRFGISRAATKLKFSKSFVSSVSRGIRRPTVPQLAKFRSVFRKSQYKRLQASGFSTKLARKFRDMSMAHVTRRVELMDSYVERLANKRIQEAMTLPHDIEKYKRDLIHDIRFNMRMSDKEWKALQYVP